MFIYWIKSKSKFLIDGEWKHHIYIGSTIDYQKRFTSHRTESKKSNMKVYKTIRECGGEDKFLFEVIEILCDDISDVELRRREQHYIDKFKSFRSMNTATACTITEYKPSNKSEYISRCIRKQTEMKDRIAKRFKDGSFKNRMYRVNYKTGRILLNQFGEYRLIGSKEIPKLEYYDNIKKQIEYNQVFHPSVLLERLTDRRRKHSVSCYGYFDSTDPERKKVITAIVRKARYYDNRSTNRVYLHHNNKEIYDKVKSGSSKDWNDWDKFWRFERMDWIGEWVIGNFTMRHIYKVSWDEELIRLSAIDI